MFGRWFVRLQLKCLRKARAIAVQRHEAIAAFLRKWGPMCPDVIPYEVGQLQDRAEDIARYDRRIADLERCV